MIRPALVAAAAAALASTASAQLVSEDFSTANTHGWAVDFVTPAPHMATGGNPGGRIEVTVQSSQSSLPAPLIVPSAAGHPWSGDFQALGVSGFRFDRQVEAGSANFGTRLYLVLGNDGGTPNTPLDDAIVFVNTGDVFQFGAVPWATIATPIPSAIPTLPAGWLADAYPMSLLSGVDPNLIWDTVIHDVSYVGIATDRPLGGAFWFGAHIISFDNFALEGATLATTSYCGPAPVNSTGQPGVMSASGSQLASANDLTLVASDLPPNQFGIFLTSRTRGFVPGVGGTSNGNLCLTGNIGRFVGPGQILPTGVVGSFSLAVDLTALPQGSGTVAAVAGDTWDFQAWYRDGMGLGSNLTDGLEIVFQ